MEETSAVARDHTARTLVLYRLILIAALATGLVPAIIGSWKSAVGQEIRSGQRPQRNRQLPAQRGDARPPQRPKQQELDDGFGSETEVDPAGDEVEGAAAEAAAPDELPKHIDYRHPLVPALRMAYASRATLSEIRDYSCQFVKKELVNGQYVTHNIDLMFRDQPFSVFLKFRAPNEGRKVLYVKGRNNGQLLAREGGLKGIITVRLNPTDALALSENRHPITDIGVANMLNSVIRQWEEEGKYGLIEVKYYPDARLGNYPVRVIRTFHPERRRQFKFHMTQLYLDGESLFPVRVEQFDWPAPGTKEPILVEQYMYSGLKPNVSLSDADFDPRRLGL